MNETNAIPVGDYTGYVNQVIDWLGHLNEKLVGAPGGVLVIIGLVILRIIWTKSPLANGHLYWLMPLCGVTAFMWLAPYREGHIREDSGRNFMIGLIFTGVAFFIYRLMIKNSKIKELVQDDTAFIKKSDVEPPKQ